MTAMTMDLDTLRHHTLAALLQLAVEHDLRLPRDVSTWPYNEVAGDVFLYFEQDEQVDLWAKVLGVDDVQDKITSAGNTWREASTRADAGETGWLGWKGVTLRCYPFHRIPVEQS